MLAKAFAVYHQRSHLCLSDAYAHFHVYMRAPLGPAAYPTRISLRVWFNLSGWKISLLPPQPCHRELLGELLPVHPSCWPPARRHFRLRDGSHYNNAGSCFAKSHSRALYQLKGNSGSVTRSIPISWEDCRHFRCSCPESLSAGTPGRGSLAASGQTWPGSCCLTQRHQGSQVQQYNLSRLQRIALRPQVEQPVSPKTQELAAPAKGVVQVWKVSFWTTKAKNFGLDSLL